MTERVIALWPELLWKERQKDDETAATMRGVSWCCHHGRRSKENHLAKSPNSEMVFEHDVTLLNEQLIKPHHFPVFSGVDDNGNLQSSWAFLISTTIIYSNVYSRLGGH